MIGHRCQPIQQPTRRTAILQTATVWAVLASLPSMAVDGWRHRTKADTQSQAHRQSRSRLLAQVVQWGCQYQRLDASAIASSNLDLIAIDDTFDGRAIEPREMAAMKRKPDGSRRLVLAYLSVGEAERHRPYFPSDDTRPDWIGSENPAWPGSFPTRYWLPQWRAILFGHTGSWLDRILVAGFDGVFLDRVDAYGDWRTERPTAMDDMAELVSALGTYARLRQQDFLLIGQNAESLLADQRYRAAIDAVSKESLLFGMAGEGVPNAQADINWSLDLLQLAARDGIKLLAIEYLAHEQRIIDSRTRLAGLGLTPFFANRLLDRLPSSEAIFP